jgi:predicted molibdopterin-dependent oxidoreductase YjgC
VAIVRQNPVPHATRHKVTALVDAGSIAHPARTAGTATWDRLERESSVTYPHLKEGDPGQPVVFIEPFQTATGRAKFVPADLV